ncbi:MAG TPA: hypothetical protein VJY47_04265 [Candidatus Dojkabacteria bacterium]|nr:hypothetical protein [Candidatus Dojkabacteria bacterium]
MVDVEVINDRYWAGQLSKLSKELYRVHSEVPKILFALIELGVVGVMYANKKGQADQLLQLAKSIEEMGYNLGDGRGDDDFEVIAFSYTSLERLYCREKADELTSFLTCFNQFSFLGVGMEYSYNCISSKIIVGGADWESKPLFLREVDDRFRFSHGHEVVSSPQTEKWIKKLTPLGEKIWEITRGAYITCHIDDFWRRPNDVVEVIFKEVDHEQVITVVREVSETILNSIKEP